MRWLNKAKKMTCPTFKLPLSNLFQKHQRYLWAAYMCLYNKHGPALIWGRNITKFSPVWNIYTLLWAFYWSLGHHQPLQERSLKDVQIQSKADNKNCAHKGLGPPMMKNSQTKIQLVLYKCPFWSTHIVSVRSTQQLNSLKVMLHRKLPWAVWSRFRRHCGHIITSASSAKWAIIWSARRLAATKYLSWKVASYNSKRP